MDGNFSQVCPVVLRDHFRRGMIKKLWQVNGLMLSNSILMGFVVYIGVFQPRARRNPIISFLLLGASTLFLPIVSNVAASIGKDMYFTSSLYNNTVLAAKCEPGMHLVLIFVWTAVIVTIGVNTSIVVVTDKRERRSIQPPAELLIKAIWVCYLTEITIKTMLFFHTTSYIADLFGKNHKATIWQLAISLELPMFLPFLKMICKYIAFYSAQVSFVFGRNPQLIVGYMDQLREIRNRNIDIINVEHTPKLIIIGEELYYELVDKPRCVNLPDVSETNLVTLDRVLEQQEDGSFLKQEHKDLCFSFALFKLLRSRFAKYTVSEAGFMEVQSFFGRQYLSASSDHDRVFQLISDELSFIDSYYNSSLPIYYAYSNWFMPSTFLSLSYCLYMFVFISRTLDHLGGNKKQMFCSVWCPGQTTPKNGDNVGTALVFGSSYFDVVPVLFVVAVLFLSEMKDIVYYVCSNWSKVALICRYLKHPPSPAMKKCIAFVVNCCRCKLVNSWNDTLSQCSILVHRPWWKPNWHLWHVKCLPSMVGDFPLWRLFGFPEQESTKELSTVKKSIFEALRNEDVTAEQEEGVKHIRLPSLIRVSGLAISGSQETVAGTVLAWHIATSLWELKDHEPERSTANGSIEQSSDSDNKIVATQLSRYCAYLVACRPELLPDEDDYCQKLYGDVLKHAHRVLRVAGAGAGFELLVLLMRGQLDELRRVDMDNGGSWTLKNGADLAEQLVDLNMGWKELAEFWSEMILYIAPSENLDGHGEAIARGGEMVTLLWALLAHAGIVDRHVEVAADTDTVVAADASNSDPSGLVNGTAADLRIGDRLVGMTTDANTAAAADASNAGEERITIVTGNHDV